MPQIQQRKKSLPLMWKVFILLGIFLLAGAISVRLFLAAREQDHKVVVNALDQRQELVLKGRYDAALKLLNEAYPKAHSKNEQLELLYYKGATNLTKGDMKAANQAFKDYEALGGLTFQVARQIGFTDAQLRDKQEAIAYYKKAIDLAHQSNINRADDEIAELNARIAELQK